MAYNSAEVVRSDVENDSALSEALTRTRVLFQSMPVGLCIVGPDGVIQAVNAVAEDLFGRTAAELSGAPLEQLFSDEGGDLAQLSKCIFGERLNRKLTARTSTGTAFPVAITATRLTPEPDAPTLIGVEDITPAENLNRMKAEFVAMVSHDLRTPLTSIQLFLEGISTDVYGACPELVKQKAMAGEREVSRLISLVHQLLQLERFEDGKVTLERVPVPVETMTGRAVTSVQALAASRDIQIETKVIDAYINADADQIVQVLINMLGNAIKYSPIGGKLTLEVVEVDERFEFRVFDQGPGIAPEQQQRIFERYAKAPNDPIARKEGTGLGLAIAKAIVTAHGGLIGVESKPGSGSMFWFRLPAD